MTSTLLLGVKSCLPRSPCFPRRTRRLIVVRLLQCLQNALDARGDFPGRDSFRTFVILHGRSHSAGMARTALLLYLAEVCVRLWTGYRLRPLKGIFAFPTTPSLAFLRICRSEEHTSELQSLMRNSYAVFRLKKKITQTTHQQQPHYTHTTYTR